MLAGHPLTVQIDAQGDVLDVQGASAANIAVLLGARGAEKGPSL